MLLTDPSFKMPDREKAIKEKQEQKSVIQEFFASLLELAGYTVHRMTNKEINEAANGSEKLNKEIRSTPYTKEDIKSVENDIAVFNRKSSNYDANIDYSDAGNVIDRFIKEVVEKNPDMFAYSKYEDIRKFVAYDKKNNRYYISQTEVDEKTLRPKKENCRHLLYNLATIESRRKYAEEHRFIRNNLKNSDLNAHEVNEINNFILSLSRKQLEKSRGISYLAVGNYIFKVEHGDHPLVVQKDMDDDGIGFILKDAIHINNFTDEQQSLFITRRYGTGGGAEGSSYSADVSIKGNNGEETEPLSDSNLQKRKEAFERVAKGKEEVRQDTLFNRELEDVRNDVKESVKKDAERFFKNFGIEVKETEDFEGDLFDAINRTINISSAEDITEGTGQTIAWMMQHSEEFKALNIMNAIKTFPHIFQGWRAYTKKKTLSRNDLIKLTGNLIARELKSVYNLEEKPKDSFLSKVWDLIASFFAKIDPSMRLNITKYMTLPKRVAEAIKNNDKSLIVDNYVKPGTTEEGQIVDVATALKENPYEESIISY